MEPELKQVLEKQHYEIVGNHSALQNIIIEKLKYNWFLLYTYAKS